MAELKTFVAIGRGKNRKFVEVNATSEWVKNTGLDDDRKITALAISHAYDAVSVYRRLEKDEFKPESILLTTKVPDGSKPILTRPGAMGLDCFVCLCDANNNCVCTPC